MSTASPRFATRIASGLGRGADDRGGWLRHLGNGRTRRCIQQHQPRHRRAAQVARHELVQRRRRLPARHTRADLARRRRHQVHRDRRRQQQHRRRSRPAAVRRRDEGHRRDGAPLRPQGRGARSRRRWHHGRAQSRRRFDRACHLHGCRDHRRVQTIQRVAGADDGGAARGAGSGESRGAKPGHAGQGGRDRGRTQREHRESDQ